MSTFIESAASLKGKDDSNILVIHDPSPRTSKRLSNDFARVSRISSGTLEEKPGRTHSAVGYFKLGGGLRIKKSADCAILDGAAVLEMEPPSTRRS